MAITFRVIPPPEAAPVDPQADSLGLARGLRVEVSQHGQWRCAQCARMQKANSPQVWVPDGILKADPEWSVTEECRRTAYNGSGSAWCVSCAPKAAPQFASRIAWWRQLFRR